MSVVHLEYDIVGGNFISAGEASGDMKKALRRMGVGADIIRRCAICMYEGEINMVIHANGGKADVYVEENSIKIILQDNGPGIPNVELAMQAGFSTATQDVRDLGFGAGMGLPNMKRYSDTIKVETEIGKGTRVEMTIMLQENSEGVTAMTHAVNLDTEKCKGCTTCIKHCPTEAIRVRNGLAQILDERCIDCGVCIRVCPHKAKIAVCDSLDILSSFKYTVALPAPSLYGQFHNLYDINIVLQGLLDIGFDNVYEVAVGAEIISAATMKYMNWAQEGPSPIISSACPAVVRLICMRFPKLLPNMITLIAPFEVAAINARRNAVEETGLPPGDIGVFFITPCPAKVTAVRYPPILKKPVVDGAISIAEVYKKLLPAMKKIEEPAQLCKTGFTGVGWARSGGEAEALSSGKKISVDGIENIIAVLEDIESDMLPDVGFLELNACNQGCVGGCLTVENPYIAQSNLSNLMKFLPDNLSELDMNREIPENLMGEKRLEYSHVWELDDDRVVAMQKYMRIETLTKELAGLDCGSCGAPSCRALAEDIVLNRGSEQDCIFRMREKMQKLTGSENADEYLPPPFRKRRETEEQ